jgi:ubiquinone/menaquinone biosynthesis C-methylase UbiE
MPGHRVCPWWLGYVLASPVRKLLHNPARILSPTVRPGMTIVEPGPGMGFFTLEMARLAGPTGRVVAVDIQPKMLARLERRAAKMGGGSRVETRLAAPDSLNLADLDGQADFVLAFAVVHELPSVEGFFREMAAVLKAGGLLLLAEPSGHVGPAMWDRELRAAADVGLTPVERPHIRRSHASLLRKV